MTKEQRTEALCLLRQLPILSVKEIAGIVGVNEYAIAKLLPLKGKQ